MPRMSLSDCLCYLTGKTFRKMLSCYMPILKKRDLTVSQLFVLLALYEMGDSTPQELSIKLALNGSTLTGILNRLEDKGLVKRRINASDKRSFVVSLTDKAKRMKDELWGIYEEVNGELRSALSQEEIEVLNRIMGKLGKKAEDMLEKERK